MFLAIFLQAGKEVDGGVGSELAKKISSLFLYFIGQIPSWIAGVIVFVLAFFVAKLAKAAIESRLESQIDDQHQEVMVLAGRVTYFGTLILGVTIALKIAGIDLTTILAAVAFGIGFALQDLIMNFLAGVLILMSRQFTIGDFIKVGSTVGVVMEIQTRATILKAIDGTKVIVPNSEIFTSQVTSYTTNPTRRVVIPLYIAYDTDIKFATKLALQVLKRHPKILKKPGPSVIINGYGDSSIDLTARFWVGSRDGWIKIKSELMHRLLEEFTNAGIVIPYNISHIETESDTAEYMKAAAELRKKKMEEMKQAKVTAATAPPGGAEMAIAPALVGAPVVPTSDVPAIASPVPAVAEPALAIPAAPAGIAETAPLGGTVDHDEMDGQG